MPLRHNDGRPVSEDKLNQTREELVNRFDGVSVQPQSILGIWVHEGTANGRRRLTMFGKPVFLVAAAFAALALGSTQSRADPIMTLDLHSEPGDYIGMGRDYHADTAHGGTVLVESLARPPTGPVNVVIFTISGPPPEFPGLFAGLAFATDKIAGNYLEPGTYRAERFPFQHTGEGGLYISMDFRGCNVLTGVFTILESEIDYSGGAPRVVRFAATFEQHCEQPDSPPLTGTLHYSDQAAPIPEPFTMALAGLAVLGLLGYHWREKRTA